MANLKKKIPFPDRLGKLLVNCQILVNLQNFYPFSYSSHYLLFQKILLGLQLVLWLMAVSIRALKYLFIFRTVHSSSNPLDQHQVQPNFSWSITIEIDPPLLNRDPGRSWGATQREVRGRRGGAWVALLCKPQRVLPNWIMATHMGYSLFFKHVPHLLVCICLLLSFLQFHPFELPTILLRPAQIIFLS